MLVADKWWSLRAILKDTIKGYGRRFQLGNWQEVAIKDDLDEHFCIKIRRFTPIAKYIFTNFFMKAIIEVWMTCETGQKFKMPLCCCIIRWDKVNINVSLLCLAPNRCMDWKMGRYVSLAFYLHLLLFCILASETQKRSNSFSSLNVEMASAAIICDLKVLSGLSLLVHTRPYSFLHLLWLKYQLIH